ncbi:hypothetical protein [Undibacterium terreum]|uniref:Uncharacterized protein n=1 Tax=Undibacterium terreum TaxID=1224302 RepID=A0A916UAH4_9BURK|nr:hypothetical protein [Undibacterium terreum]GGC65444.1 hypothetical protein GCM10011396_10540 [Undibacterium terreum]
MIENISAMLGALLPAPVAQPVVKSFGKEKSFPEMSAGAPIKRNEAYFEVRLNQMCLANNVKWFSVYDPLVVITVGFDYGGKSIEVPAVLGPGIIQKHLDSGAPQFGTVLSDLKVIGPHPYRGSGISISISFYRVERMNYTRSLLKVIERLSGIIGMGQIATLASTGGALLDGLEGLLGGGATVCMAAYKFNLPPPNYPLQTGYTALIVPPVPDNLDTLLVRDSRLLQKEGGEERPFAGSDFVLISVAGMQRRENEQFFSAYDLKEQALSIISEGEASRKRAKAIMLSAFQQLRGSDDFTKLEADLLFEEWLQEFDKEVSRYSRANAMPIRHNQPELALAANDLNQAMDRLSL